MAHLTKNNSTLIIVVLCKLPMNGFELQTSTYIYPVAMAQPTVQPNQLVIFLKKMYCENNVSSVCVKNKLINLKL